MTAFLGPRLTVRIALFEEAAGEVDATWTHQRTGPGNRINYDGSGNAVAAAAGEDAFVFDNANTYQPNQWVRGQASVLTTGTQFVRVTARASLTGDASYQCYFAKTDGTTVVVGKVVADVTTVFLSFAASFSVSNWLELYVCGDVLQVLNTGVLLATVRDSSITTGSAGFGLEVPGAANLAEFSAWESGIFGTLSQRRPYRSRSPGQTA